MDIFLVSLVACFILSMFSASSRRWNWFTTFLIAGFLLGIRLLQVTWHPMKWLTLCDLAWKLYDACVLSDDWKEYLKHRAECSECKVEIK